MKAAKILWTPQSKLLVAVSGGIDSVVLLDWLVRQSNTYQQLAIVHVDHGLRQESRSDYRFVEQLAQYYQLAFYGYHCDVIAYKQQHHLGTQQAAREVRYACFDQAMQQSDSQLLLTAHHGDDQSETIIYRLMTGRFHQQSLGINELSTRNNYQIARPLLKCSRQQIQAYYDKRHLKHVEDSSNAQLTYHRNQIRHLLMPICQQIMPQTVQHLDDFNQHYQAQQQFINQYSQQLLTQLILSIQDNKVVINRKEWLMQDQIIQQTMLYQLCQQYANINDLKHHSVASVCHMINTAQGEKQYYLKSHCLVRVSYDKMTLLVNDIKKTAEIEPIILNQQHLQQYVRFDNYQCILSVEKIDETSVAINEQDLPLCIRTYRQGDQVVLKNGHKKVRRLFIDHKLPQHLRATYPIVENKQGEIIAVGQLYQQQRTMSQYYLTITLI